MDKNTGKLHWTENHETKEAALKAVEAMKESHFNPKYFRFLIKA
jgi:predicted GIY-YIG superfamily endonuclease